MEPSVLASHNAATRMTSTLPIDSRRSSISNLPSRPARVAQLDYHLPSSSRQPAYAEYPVWDEKHAHYSHRQSHNTNDVSPTGTGRFPGSSVSSSGGNSVMTGNTVDTIDIEKGVLEPPPRQSESRRSSRAMRGRQEMSERHSNTYYHSSGQGSGNSLPHESRAASVQSELDDEQEMLEHRQLLESKALNILLFSSGPCAALSLILCFYSLFATVAIFMLAPLRLCTKPTISLWEQLLATLSSAQRLQLRCIYAPTSHIEGKSVASLLANLMLSPLLSMGVAVAGWTVAIYWVFAAIVGDPDGSEGGDDGVSTVLGLRNWWAKWLSRAIRE